ncbi:MAG TPA: glycosyltransferase family 87 protein [Candidatus Limnocylindrales bacterium]
MVAASARAGGRSQSRRRALTDGLTLAGIVAAVFVWQAVVFGIPNSGDAWSYWMASASDPYAAARQHTLLPYLYSPAFLQFIAPLRALDWTTFRAVWTAILIVAIVLQAGPLTLLALAFPPVLIDLEVGNIHTLLALAIVLGFRWPAAWAFVLLTKVTPGIGLLWFAFRREWRKLAIALGTTLAIVVVSFAVAPQLWTQWLVVADHPSVAYGALPVALPYRLAIAGCLTYVAARTDRRYLVLVASTVALPDLWVNGAAMLVGLAQLLPLPDRRTNR